MSLNIGNIFGPLSQIWDFLEGQKNVSHEQISQIEGDIPKIVTEKLLYLQRQRSCRIMDMSIAMIGQAFNSLFYYRVEIP